VQNTSSCEPPLALWCCPIESFYGSDLTIEAVADRATAMWSGSHDNVRTEHLMKRVESMCKSLFDSVVEARKAKDLAGNAKPKPTPFVSPDGRETRADGVVNEMKKSPEDAYDVLQSQPTPTKKQVMTRLAEKMNDLDELKAKLARLKDHPSAVDMLEQFDSCLTNHAFLN